MRRGSSPQRKTLRPDRHGGSSASTGGRSRLHKEEAQLSCGSRCLLAHKSRQSASVDGVRQTFGRQRARSRMRGFTPDAAREAIGWTRCVSSEAGARRRDPRRRRVRGVARVERAGRRAADAASNGRRRRSPSRPCPRTRPVAPRRRRDVRRPRAARRAALGRAERRRQLPGDASGQGASSRAGSTTVPGGAQLRAHEARPLLRRRGGGRGRRPAAPRRSEPRAQPRSIARADCTPG